MKIHRLTVSAVATSFGLRVLCALLPVLPSAVLQGISLPASKLQMTGSTPSNYRPDRILVRPLPGIDLSLLNLQLGATVLRTFPDLGNLQVLRVPAGTPSLSLVSVYRQSGLVQYAEPDYRVRLLREPNDFRYWDGSLWALRNTGQLGGTPGADIKAPEGWDTRNTADNIVVAVIDTGMRLTHEDLALNRWTNPGESGLDAQGNDRRTNGLDDDGNGFVDDAHGINAITGSGNPADDFGHGSHVNGIIGGVGDNSVGVVGVAWRVQLMNCKFIDAQGNGSISDAITCIDYARRKAARIINASWGAVDFQSAALREAIAAARDTGILFVAAAGNSAGNNDSTPLYPASYDLDNIIAVAATNRQDNLSFFSNYGATTVDLAAPGEDIFSAWSGSDSDYRYLSGSSMAASYVSGVAAVLMAHATSENFGQIRQRILNGTDPLPALAGRVATGGRLNLFRALGAGGGTPTAPAAPGNLAATATSTSRIALAWTDNADNEDGFRIERSIDNASFAGIATTDANTTTYADTGLAAATTYYYRVRTFNSAGNSAYSNTASATTQGAPPPTPFVVSVQATDAAASESGDPGAYTITRAGDGPLTPLTVSYAMSGAAQNGADYQPLAGSAVIPDGATSATVTLTPIDDSAEEGAEAAVLTLTSGADYTVGSPSSAAVTIAANDSEPAPPTPPAAPSELSATAVSTSQINLAWTDNANNEEGFRIERSTDNASFTEIATAGANTTAYSATGLTADTTYYYRVRAFHGAGNSGYSNTASARTQSPPPPSASATVTVTASDLLAGEAGPNPGEFIISRTGDTSSALTMKYSLSGTAANGSDYQALSGTAIIPDGASSVAVRVVPIDDRVVELAELVVLTLSGDAGYQIGLLGVATVTIADNDLLAGPLL